MPLPMLEKGIQKSFNVDMKWKLEIHDMPKLNAPDVLFLNSTYDLFAHASTMQQDTPIFSFDKCKEADTYCHSIPELSSKP